LEKKGGKLKNGASDWWLFSKQSWSNLGLLKSSPNFMMHYLNLSIHKMKFHKKWLWKSIAYGILPVKNPLLTSDFQ